MITVNSRSSIFFFFDAVPAELLLFLGACSENFSGAILDLDFTGFLASGSLLSPLIIN
jgi:hypothetical protein